MNKYISAAAAVLLPAVALAQPFDAGARSSMPTLSGTYDVIIHGLCQTTLTVKTSSGDVSNMTLSTGAKNLSATFVGTLAFTQGLTGGAGQAKLKAVAGDGTVFFLKNSGKAGTSGVAMDIGSGTANDTFSQSATTLTLVTGGETSTFNVYYGAVSGGVAQAAVFGGIDGVGCADAATLVRQ